MLLLYLNSLLKELSGSNLLTFAKTSSIVKSPPSGKNIRSPAPRLKPLRCVTKSLTVNSSVTKSSGILNSGMCFLTLSSQSNFPSSTKIAKAKHVKPLLLEATPTSVFSFMSLLLLKERTPWPLA